MDWPEIPIYLDRRVFKFKMFDNDAGCTQQFGFVTKRRYDNIGVFNEFWDAEFIDGPLYRGQQ